MDGNETTRIDGALMAMSAIEHGKQGDHWCYQTTALVFDGDKVWLALAKCFAVPVYPDRPPS